RSRVAGAVGVRLTIRSRRRFALAVEPRNRDTFSDAERQPRQTTASSSQENTIESDIVHPQRSGDETGEAQTTKPKEETKTKHSRAGNPFSKIRNRAGQDGGSASKNMLQSQQPEPAAVLFPDCVPESLRPTFGITQDTHLVARVFAADCTSIAKQLKQTKESLISDSSKRKMKIKGKSRSVWLSPTAGEKIEVWKLYFNADNRCEKLLAWLPGTDLFGYILPEEVDRDKQFSSAADQSRYEAAIQSLALSQDDYDVEGPPLTPTEPCDEDQGEIYMHFVGLSWLGSGPCTAKHLGTGAEPVTRRCRSSRHSLARASTSRSVRDFSTTGFCFCFFEVPPPPPPPSPAEAEPVAEALSEQQTTRCPLIAPAAGAGKRRDASYASPALERTAESSTGQLPLLAVGAVHSAEVQQLLTEVQIELLQSDWLRRVHGSAGGLVGGQVVNEEPGVGVGLDAFVDAEAQQEAVAVPGDALGCLDNAVELIGVHLTVLHNGGFVHGAQLLFDLVFIHSLLSTQNVGGGEIKGCWFGHASGLLRCAAPTRAAHLMATQAARRSFCTSVASRCSASSFSFLDRAFLLPAPPPPPPPPAFLRVVFGEFVGDVAAAVEAAGVETATTTTHFSVRRSGGIEVGGLSVTSRNCTPDDDGRWKPVTPSCWPAMYSRASCRACLSDLLVELVASSACRNSSNEVSISSGTQLSCLATRPFSLSRLLFWLKFPLVDGGNQLQFQVVPTADRSVLALAQHEPIVRLRRRRTAVLQHPINQTALGLHDQRSGRIGGGCMAVSPSDQLIFLDPQIRPDLSKVHQPLPAPLLVQHFQRGQHDLSHPSQINSRRIVHIGVKSETCAAGFELGTAVEWRQVGRKAGTDSFDRGGGGFSLQALKAVAEIVAHQRHRFPGCATERGSVHGLLVAANLRAPRADRGTLAAPAASAADSSESLNSFSLARRFASSLPTTATIFTLRRKSSAVGQAAAALSMLDLAAIEPLGASLAALSPTAGPEVSSPDLARCQLNSRAPTESIVNHSGSIAHLVLLLCLLLVATLLSLLPAASAAMA
uniref:BRCT domain-containing protein n=1 Tax=Macrostomum lignano TaxID=282301 RepID=A0A1I8I622_9PLAT